MSRGSLAGAAYEHAKAAILDGAYQPGARLPVEEMAGTLGMSRQPMMDAMRRLETDGLVTIRPQIGCVVAEIVDRDADDLVVIFAETSSILAGLAASRRTDHDLSRLVDVLDFRPTDTYSADALSHRYRLHNREFHTLVFGMARSKPGEFIAHKMFDLMDLVTISKRLMPELSSTMSQAVAEHRQIAEAITAGDVSGAADVARAHVLRHHVAGSTAGGPLSLAGESSPAL